MFIFMPTLQDVAKKAGVSTATVSKVLSNTPYFTDETRDKVIKAVDELGYIPNLAARALSTGKTNIIAVVFPYVYDRIFKDPLVMHILEGIESETSQSDYNILLSTPRITDDGVASQFTQLMNSGYIDGVIAIDNVPLASVTEVSRTKKVPTVVIGYAENDYSVRSDDFSGGQQLTQHLLSLGHRKIGIISVPENMNYAINQRLVGIRATLDNAGIDFDMLPHELSDFSTVGGAKAVNTLISENPELTAVICINDRMAMGAIQQLLQMGKRVPEDISVVGYDNITNSETVTPPLTTIDQHAGELGRSGAEMLMAILNEQKPESIVLPTQLLVRASSKTATH